jgi:tetratricopeptide (TPR) repeat protein
MKKVFILAILCCSFFGFAATAENVTYNMAVQMRVDGNFDNAESAFLILSEQQPKNSDILFQLGLVQRMQQKMAKAMLSQKRALEIAPKNADVQIELARLYKYQHDYVESKLLLKQVLVIYPDYKEASDLLLELEQITEAPKSDLWQLDLGHERSTFSRQIVATGAIAFCRLVAG